MESKTIDKTVLEQTQANICQTLLNARREEGVWCGSLSSSPLATAVAVFALHQVDGKQYHAFIENGLRWLANSQQADGSWGDAEQLDPGNLSTTLLCYAAFYAIDAKAYDKVISNAQGWIEEKVGEITAEHISNCLYKIYGKDRTFAVPILTLCALAGVLGDDGWQYVKPLPFELAALPRCFFKWLKLNVVSYALPALIAMGQAKYYFDPPSNPVLRWLRKCFKDSTLQLLQKIQPTNGGFLEAAPLTSFVVMCLAAMGLRGHSVVLKGVEFITASMQSNGSWRIDTNLSTWVTSLSVRAIVPSKNQETLTPQEKQRICDWYLSQQFQDIHPYTGASPGGWGWTNLPGSVPDADDTAGALVALHELGIRNEAVLSSVSKGIHWLLDLQNNDGGVPTFCRGWGKLEFDRSCPDITAHAMMAWHLWKDAFDLQFKLQMEKAIERGVSYLYASQCPDGSWLPLWFGSPFSQSKNNPLYGTAKVMDILTVFKAHPLCEKMLTKASAFLVQGQNSDGGWGSQKQQVSTIEETALAVAGLLASGRNQSDTAVQRGLEFLIEKTQQGTFFESSPIGLYFAKLWYAERLYPIIFSLQAFQKV